MAELDLRGKRKHSPNWSENYFNAVFPGQSGLIDVKNAEAGTRAKVDLKVAAAYILTLPQWFNTLESRRAYGSKIGRVRHRSSTSRLCRMVQPWLLAQLENLLQRPQRPAQQCDNVARSPGL